MYNFCDKISEFPKVPSRIRKHGRSVTHGAYWTYRAYGAYGAYGAHGTFGTN